MTVTTEEVPVVGRPIVLCVDDDLALLQAIVRSLGAVAAEVISTTSPHLALEMIASRDIAVLISDHEMPDMTGVELATAARRLRPDTVRILLTGRHQRVRGLPLHQQAVRHQDVAPRRRRSTRSAQGARRDEHARRARI
jgi:CheY-like chemotaxis protein